MIDRVWNAIRPAVTGGLLLALAASMAAAQGPGQPGDSKEKSAVEKSGGKTLKVATFGGGCFWCVEAVFQRVKGVERVVSGYAGGKVPNPTYKQVTTGLTGHAEVVQITYDPSVVEFKELLEVFWKTHDPTTPNRQGADIGTQYRSIILYSDDEQKELAQTYKQKIDEAKVFSKKLVTQIVPLTEFYPAEDYHQNYFNNNFNAPYCQAVIVPKLQKFQKVFGDKAK